MAVSQRDIEATLRLKDELSKNIQKANKSLKALNKQVGKNHNELKKIGKSVSFVRLAGTIISAQVAMRAFSAAFRGVRDVIAGSIRASSDFNDAFTKSTAIMGDLSRAMRNEMTQAAEEVARTTTFSAKEAAEAYFFLASAGLDAAQSIKALPQVAAFAQAGTFDLATATDLLTDAQSALGLTIRDDVIANMENMGRVSDVLVKANTMANASVQQFSEAITTKAGASMRQWSKDIEEGIAVLAVFADQGIKGAEAGTAFSIVLRDLSTKALKNADEFKKHRIAVFDDNEQMRNTADIIADLENALGKMSDAQAKATLLQLGFSDKSVVFVQSLIGMSDAIREYEERARDAAGTTELIAGKQMESFASQVKVAQNHWEILLKTLGDFITQGKIGKEILKFLIDSLVRLTDSLIENREQWIGLVGGGIDLALGGIDAFLTATGLMIAGLAKVGKALLWVQDLLPRTQPESWIQGQRAMVKEMEAFGEGLLRGAAEVDLLQEKLRFATKVQLDNAAAQKESAAQTLEFRKALTGLRDTMDDVGGRVGGLKVDYEKLVSAMEPGAVRDFGASFKSIEDVLLRIKPVVQDVRDEFEGWLETTPPIAANLGRTLVDFVPQMRGVGGATKEAAEEVDHFNEILQQGANLTIIFGRSIGGLIASLAGAAGALKSLFGGGKGLSGFLEGFRAKDLDTGEMKTTFGSFLSGFAKALPAIGALAAPIVALFGKIFKPKWKKLAEESAKIFGQALSEGLSKELVKLAKELGSTQNAFAARIGDIVSEVGVNAGNLNQILASFHQMLGMVENGTLAWADAMEQVDKAFPALVASLEELGVKGDFAIGKLITRMRELGEVTQEVQDFIKQKAEEAISALSTYFAYLAEKQELTAEQAKNALTVMAGAFQAAVAAAGSLAGAIAMLGDDFGVLLEKMREVLGDENALLNAIQRYYNYVKANEDVLAALDALAQGFRALAQLGLVNRDNINEYAAALKDMFDEILGSAKDQQAALAAIAPQIAMLLEAYRELGLDVPDWLAEIAAKATEAGASLEPPEGLPDILKDIRDIMKSIAEYFGVAADNAKDFGRNVGNIPDIPDVPGGGGRRDRDYPGYQHGGYVPANPPYGSVIRVGEREGEYVIPKSKMGGGASSSIINVTVPVTVSGVVVGTQEELARVIAPAVQQAIRDGRLGSTLQGSVN